MKYTSPFSNFKYGHSVPSAAVSVQVGAVKPYTAKPFTPSAKSVPPSTSAPSAHITLFLKSIQENPSNTFILAALSVKVTSSFPGFQVPLTLTTLIVALLASTVVLPNLTSLVITMSFPLYLDGLIVTTLFSNDTAPLNPAKS